MLNDGIVDPANFYFTVNLSNPTNAVLGVPASTQVNMLDVQSYNQPPGTPDLTFNNPDPNSTVYSLALQTNGQILVAGNFTAVGSVPEGYMARLNANGGLDTSFLSGTVGSGQ